MSLDNVSSNFSGGFDFTDLITFLWQKKLRIVISVSILTALGTFYVKSLPKIYSASSTILLSEKNEKLSIGGNLTSVTKPEDNKIDTYIELIKSKLLARKVVENLKLHEREEFKKKLADGGTVIEIDNAVNKLLKHLKLSKIANTDMLKVTYESELAVTTADVVNEIGPTFFEFERLSHQKQVNETTRWLDEQLLALSTRLDIAETELENFMQENGLIDLESQIELVKTEITKLIEHRLVVGKELSSSESTIKQIQNAKGDRKQLMQIPAILNDELIRTMSAELFKTELMLDELSKRYEHKHHKIIAIQGTADAITQNLDRSLQKVVDSLIQDDQSIKNRANELEQQLEAARVKHAALGAHEIDLASLRRKTLATQKLYDVFLTRLQEAEILRDLDAGDEFSVIDYAQVPHKHIKPRVMLGAVFSLIFSSIFSIGFWLIIHLIADKHTRFKQLLAKHGVLILGEIPRPPKKQAKTKSKRVTKKELFYADAIRSLRSELVVHANNAAIRTIAITHVSENTNSALTIDIAESFSYIEKSLLIDCNLRSPQIGKVCERDSLTPGLTNYLGRRLSFGECKFQNGHSQLHVMPSGPVPNDPLMYLTNSKFYDFIQKLKKVYKRTIIETPHVTGYNDVLVISKSVDAVVLLCDLESADNQDLTEAIQRLLNAGVPILGVVFERVKNINRKRSAIGKMKIARVID
ncbi:polysaccharide biosynthesis tyrosine autokinase [Paraglaciecola aquimarina]|uniref:Polysaccharide biosynthesis tyrosine autokinase n=1 Tax=Paraglaciecola algarum TaxID=3050085 RepID=A0ABS9D5H1_9ALTE|nr:polysaccharide biosynthesis tyrosine autokinase [Paraglaciecola sp. G1-23]MCF2947687.1 polysaccharide biosynthesis tyrosine autokinase [Paraglaciecola sp. G1-23]